MRAESAARMLLRRSGFRVSRSDMNVSLPRPVRQWLGPLHRVWREGACAFWKLLGRQVACDSIACCLSPFWVISTLRGLARSDRGMVIMRTPLS